MITTAEPSTECKCCHSCGTMLPLTEFRRRSRGSSRESDCRRCHARYERIRRRANSDHDLLRRLRQLRRERSAKRAVGIVQGVIASAGGLPKLVRRWQELIESSKPAAGLTALNSVMNLWHATEKLQHQQQQDRERRRDRKLKLRKQQERRYQDRLDAMSDAELSAHLEELRLQHGYSVEEWKQLRAQYDREESWMNSPN